MSDLPDLAKAIMDNAAKRVRLSPRNSTRASEIGHECERYLVLSRTHWQEKEPPNATLQRVFDLGNLIESGVMRDLSESGIKVVEQQRSFAEKDLQLTGSIDGDVLVEMDGKATAYPLEVKGLAHHTWLALNEWKDFFDHSAPWVRRYPGQLTMYQYMEAKEWGCFLILSKQTYVPKCIWCPLDFDLADHLIKKCERINAHIAAGTLPEQCDDISLCIDDNRRCDFFHICLPEIKRTALEFKDDPELEAKLDRWNELKPLKAEYDKLDDGLKETFKGQEKILVGNYLITGKEVHRKGYEVKDSDYWQKKILPIVEGGDEA
jgi:hypothetical protein